MPNVALKQKNVLIVPLSLFIKINKKLPENLVDDLLTIEEEKEAFRKFSAQLEAILQSQLVADFNLGKYTANQFLLELLKFLALVPKPLNELNLERLEILKNTMKSAWNALIQFDSDSNEAFNALIKLAHQGKSIYFIGNTNALHAEEILACFINFPYNNVYVEFSEQLPKKIQAVPFAISQLSDSVADNVLAQQHGLIYFCLSYFYNTLIESPQNFVTTLFKPSEPALLAQLKSHLKEAGKTRDDIMLVTPYPKKAALNRTLNLEVINKENFYAALRNCTTIPPALPSYTFKSII